MDIAAMSIDSSLASVQSAISMITIRKAMNQDAASMAGLLEGFMEANPPIPVPAGEVGHLMDIRA